MIAHRGASGLVRYGNTAEAFDAAVDCGADFAELDVRRTSDGALVVYHDDHLGEARVADLPFDALFAATSALGFPVLRFEDLLARWAPRIGLDIELKEAGYEAEIVALVRRYCTPERAVVKSFSDRAVAAFKQLAPEFAAGQLVGDFDGRLRTAAREWFPERRLRRTGADFVSPGDALVHAGFLARMRALGRPVYVWTVNDPARMRQLVRAGVDALVTDRPDLALAIAQELR